MTKDEALKLALEALELSHPRFGIGTAIHIKAVAVIKEALAQPEQEPVAWICEGSASDEKHAVDYQQEDIDAVPVGTMLYTTPPQPEQNQFNPDWDAMAVMVEEQQRMAKRIAELEAQRKPLTDEEMFKIAEIAWRHGWASCRDAEYIGEEAEDERWGMGGAEVVQDIAAHGIKGPTP